MEVLEKLADDPQERRHLVPTHEAKRRGDRGVENDIGSERIGHSLEVAPLHRDAQRMPVDQRLHDAPQPRANWPWKPNGM
jgi:hypothetical protein